jgi:Fe-S oxidoreductase
MEYRGSLSSEHGDGRARSWLNREFFGPELYSLYQEVKRTFDPQNILNPGNLVDAGPMTENLRFGAGYQAMPIRTSIDFSADLGFDRAVEMCNGAGICRKRTAGTMCPSFMVTREEEHSTRGRANALRAAISGLIPPEELTSPRMFQVMDLCVECKACKAECPSSVDMAKIKFEFLNQYYRVHTPSLRSRMFADFPRISRFTSGALAPLANLTVGAAPVRWGLEKALGISSRRRMPEFAREPFHTWARKRSIPGVSVNRTARGGKPQVALFNDTFNNFNSPGISQAALEVLEAAGYEVIVPDYTCCGRPSISKGFANKAREAARQTVNLLNPLVSSGIPVVGLEPSCILTFRDEYLYLLPGDQATRELADQSFTFEEFIANLNARGELRLEFEEINQKVLFHGHCHQKSLVGTGPSEMALSLVPGSRVEVVDSGCCGMAGSFGYEAEHYDISLAMAERRLLPAVRAEPVETLIAATGTSCRQQIRHGTGRAAVHPAEILRMALKP